MLNEELPRILTALPGPKSKAVIERRAQAVADGVGCKAPCVIKCGAGAMFEDLDGNLFLDWVGGIGALNIGQSHPEVAEAVREQSERYFHTSISILHYPEYIALAEKLNAIAPVRGEKRKSIFLNSGAEAVENAVKFARKYTGRSDIVVFTGAFHGRTNLTLAMTAKVKPYKFGMGPFAPGIHRCEYPYLYRGPAGMSEGDMVLYYLEKLERMFVEYVSPEETAAIVIEPVQGEGGFIAAPIEYIKGLRALCDRYGILLIADEVQSGFCRTGRMFASHHWQEAGVEPDLIACAKSIAGGLPLSAVTGRAKIMDAPAYGEVGGTCAGNPVCCAAALKVIEIMERDDYAGKARAIEAHCTARFRAWQEEIEMIGDIRALGAMMALEFVRDRRTKEPAAQELNAVVAHCVQKGLMTVSTGVRGNIMRFLMPLCITERQLEAGLAILGGAIRTHMR